MRFVFGKEVESTFKQPQVVTEPSNLTCPHLEHVGLDVCADFCVDVAILYVYAGDECKVKGASAGSRVS